MTEQDRPLSTEERQAIALEDIARSLGFLSQFGREFIAALLASGDVDIPPEVRTRFEKLLG